MLQIKDNANKRKAIRYKENIEKEIDKNSQLITRIYVPAASENSTSNGRKANT